MTIIYVIHRLLIIVDERERERDDDRERREDETDVFCAKVF